VLFNEELIRNKLSNCNGLNCEIHVGADEIINCGLFAQHTKISSLAMRNYSVLSAIDH